MAENLLFAESIQDALGKKDKKSVFYAGGTEINRLDSKIHADTLISIRKIKELNGIASDKGLVWIGAATTFQNAVDNKLVPEYFKDALLMMASRTKRNMATIGGNIALCRCDSYILPCLVGAKASIVYMKDGKEVSSCICEFIEKSKAVELNDALIIKIGLDPNRKVQNKRFANTAMSHSSVNVSFGTDTNGKNISIGAAVKHTGVMKLSCLEKKIEEDASFRGDSIVEFVKGCNGCEFKSDIFGSAEYKRYLLGTTIAKMADCVK